jgi:UDP-2-acetamido-2,6-beta-L-arabino-hexul-4-ose reductase
MLKIGITGQSGFVGTHLYNTLGLYPERFERIDFKKDFYSDNQLLDHFVVQCDVIVHLAALNRHINLQVLYDTNIELVKKLTASLERTKTTAHVIICSSTQEENDTLYGKSKKHGREILADWAKINNALFTGMIIPNVFGPFGHPYYNSVIATFSYQLTHDEQPKIVNDCDLKLIYVGDLVFEIINVIQLKIQNPAYQVNSTSQYKVSELLLMLNKYKEQYLGRGEIPNLESSFEINLFNTFRSYIDYKSHFPVHFKKNSDYRGSFVEVIRLGIGGQVSFSTTLPEVTRGNHYHTRKIERFAVIKGKALIQLRRIGTDEVLDFCLDGDKPSYVDIPIWYTHNITNIGDEVLYTIFWINQFYDQRDPDTFFEIV